MLIYLHTRGGGHWRYARELAEALSSMVRVAIVCAEGSDQAPGLEVRRVLSPIDEHASGARRVLDRIRAYRRHVDELARFLAHDSGDNGVRIVHFQELPTFSARAAVRMARAHGYKVVITVHNVRPHAAGLTSQLRQRDALRAWSSADALIVHTHHLKLELRQWLPSASIEVIQHPLWPARRSLDVGRQKEFLFFGLLRENKGIQRFVDALAQLGNPPASIVGSGSPEMVADVRRWLEQRGLSQCEFLPGYLPEEKVAGLFAAHRVLVAPYERFAAQSGVTHLAIAHHRPVVVSNVGGLAEPVETFGVGEIAGEGVEGLSEAMRTAATRQRSGYYETGFNAAHEALSVHAIAEATTRVYDSLAEGRR